MDPAEGTNYTWLQLLTFALSSLLPIWSLSALTDESELHFDWDSSRKVSQLMHVDWKAKVTHAYPQTGVYKRVYKHDIGLVC